MHLHFNKKKKRQQGASLVLVLVVLVTGLLLASLFFKKSLRHTSQNQMGYDSAIAHYRAVGGIEVELAKLKRGVEGFRLRGRLPYISEGGTLSSEEYTALFNKYGQNTTTALLLLKHAIESQGINADGTPDTSSEFTSFATAFPSEFVDDNPSDEEFFERRFTFTAMPPVIETAPGQGILFEYAYKLEVRAYGNLEYSQSAWEHHGSFEIRLTTAPFSQYALFRASNTNQNGLLLVFAGGNSTAQQREVFAGPVHMNSNPFFFGHPIFKALFSATTAFSGWWQGQSTDYTCCAVFEEPREQLTSPINLPSNMGNLARMAAGDPSSTALTNTAAASEAQLVTWLSNHALGSLPGGTTSVPVGIYIPTSSGAPTGGIYIEGDANVQLRVAQGEGAFLPEYWSNIALADRACKFQKIAIDPADGSVAPRDIYIGDDPCNVTYVFDNNNRSAAPVVLSGRPNGNLYVDGSLNEIGAQQYDEDGVTELRTPAIATDFSFTFAALKDVRVKNHLEYEDAYYVTLNPDGSVGETVVANPYGELNTSGYTNYSTDIGAKIDTSSQTIAGLVSVARSVYVHQDAPSNMNLHAAVYAGNSNQFDAGTGLGCGVTSSGTNGCGFGYEAWDIKTGMGSLKILGSISEYRSQTIGRLSTIPTGYQRRFVYDTRLYQDLMPPAFPVSTRLQAYPLFHTTRTFRVAQSE